MLRNVGHDSEIGICTHLNRFDEVPICQDVEVFKTFEAEELIVCTTQYAGRRVEELVVKTVEGSWSTRCGARLVRVG